MDPFRTFGYVRASIVPEIGSADAQRALIEQYCRRVGLKLDGVFVNPADSVRQPLFRREAGGSLARQLRPGDHVVVARIGGLAGSFFAFVSILQAWFMQGVTTHILDNPPVCLDANSPLSRAVLEALIAFTRASCRRIGTRARVAFFHLRQEGRRCSRHPPFGFRWVKRRDGKTYLARAR